MHSNPETLIETERISCDKQIQASSGEPALQMRALFPYQRLPI